MSDVDRNPRLLIAGLTAADSVVVARALARVGYLVEEIADPDSAVARIEVEPPDVAVFRLDAEGPGPEMLLKVSQLQRRPRVLALVDHPEYEVVRSGVRRGVAVFQGWPCAEHELLAACERAVEPDDLGAHDERRAHPRRRLTVEVEVQTPQYQPIALGELIDLSTRGARIELAADIEPGTPVRVGLAVHGTRLPLELDGLVLWRRAGRRNLCHGVAFLDLTPETDRQLRHLLDPEA